MQIFSALKPSSTPKSPLKALVSALSGPISRVFSQLSAHFPENPSSSSSPKVPNSSECVQKMTSFRISSFLNTFSNFLLKNLQFAFSGLKFNRASFQIPDHERSVPGDTFQTSTQARNILLKSENLCRRVSSLVDQLGSQIGSKDSCESGSSRLNLHIPRGSLINTPLSPLSMGELDTDRISNKLEEVEIQIEQYNLVLTVWKSWKSWASNKVYSRENKIMAQDFRVRKLMRSIFGKIKEKYRKRAKNKEKIVLAQGSYVQKKLRKILGAFKKWVLTQKEKKLIFGKIFGKKKKRIFNSWKVVAGVLGKKWKKIREFRKKWDKRVLVKFYKYFVIVSMIVQRVNKQKKIAETYNRDRLLKLGFQHITLSVLTNKYYNSLNTLSVNHNEKCLKKKYFEQFYLNVLTQKRIKVVKTTGIRQFRRTSLTKAMQKLYSFYSYSKQFRQKYQSCLNYYTSNLYLKTLVSWQSYHVTARGKQKLNIKSRDLFKKKNTLKTFKTWKKWTPKLKHLRTVAENIQSEKQYRMLTEYLLEWAGRTKSRLDKRTVFENRKILKVIKKGFVGLKTYWVQKANKNEKFFEKSEKLGKNMAKRIFKAWKTWGMERGKLRKKGEILKMTKAQKAYRKWRLVFLRKIIITPLVLKRNFLYIWRRWKKFVQSTSSQYKQIKKANLHNLKRVKTSYFKKWLRFQNLSQQHYTILSHFTKTHDKKISRISINAWKSFTLSSRLKKLKSSKAQNHFLYSQKLKVFQQFQNFLAIQEDQIENLTKTFKCSIITKKLIRPGSVPKNFEDNKNLDSLLLKSKGVSQWFLSIQQSKNKSNDILSILSNSLTIEVSETFFNKEAVEAIQTRRQRLAKRILGYWRQFVDVSKRKYKSALTHYKDSLRLKLKSCYQAWKTRTRKNLKCKLLLTSAKTQLSNHKLQTSLKSWKIFTKTNQIHSHQTRLILTSRLSKYLSTIMKYWKNYTKYKLTIKKLVKNFLSIRRSKLIFQALKQHLIIKLKVQNSKSDNFFTSKFFGHWTQFIVQNRKNRREKKRLNEKAQDLFYDFASVRALKRLKQHAEGRLLLKKANQVFFENAFKKVFRRWSGLHERYWKKMRLAKRIEAERWEKQKSFCLKKWFYVSHLSSWKNRAEKRLFFYWDQRLKRILFTWKKIAVSKTDNFEKIYEFRVKVLQKKSIKALKNQKSLKSETNSKIQNTENLRKKIFTRKIFSILQKFHEYSRLKLKNLTTALQFRYTKTCEKFLGKWEVFARQSKAKKGKLKKNFSQFIRNYGLKKSGLTAPQINRILKPGVLGEFEYLQFFSKSLSSGVVKGRNYQAIGIFVKWRSLVGCKTISNYNKSVEFNSKTLKTKSFQGWLKGLLYAKSRRKTLRSAIIFYRTNLKKRVFSKWKPKKVIRRRK